MIRWPWVSRAALDAVDAHRAMVSNAYYTECRRHDDTRAELAKLTMKMAEIASAAAAPIATPSLPASTALPDLVSDTIDAIAEGDTQLRGLLRKRAVAWRKRFPDLSDDALAECLRTNSLPQQATA